MRNAVATRVSFLLLAWLVGSGFPAAQEGRTQQLARSVLPIHLQVLFMPPPFKSQGLVGLAYELHVAGFREIELALVQLEVLPVNDPTHPLATIAGQDLRRCIRRPGKPAGLANPERIGGGEFGVVFLWVALDSTRAVPRAIAHRATFLRTMTDGSQKEYVVEGATTAIPTERPIVIRPPLPAGRWLMANGPSMLGDHRLDLQAIDGRPSGSQRFAADWMLLGPDGRLARGTPARNADWHGYGVSVLAAADGVVESVGDGVPENVPLSAERAAPNRRDTVAGNYVVIRLRAGVYAFYGHLQPKSLRVASGDRVRSGQVLGLLGNSGNSDAPHLHFHLTNSNDPLSGEGIPFAFDSYAVLDVLDVTAWTPMLQDNAPWRRRASGQGELRRNEMPTGEAIIEFR
jgi:murein DD-endopeptidase MepM/ murein hydrolase activator NlpD